MQALCSLDVQGEKAIDSALSFVRETEDTPETLREAETMLLAAWHAREASDQIIERRSRHWNINRMPLVDRGILRLAIWEITSRHAPAMIVVAESVRMAQEFSTADSPRFINGVLEAVARELGEGGTPPTEQDDQ
jgi:transcription antitermination protein NusB